MLVKEIEISHVCICLLLTNFSIKFSKLILWGGISHYRGRIYKYLKDFLN